MNKKLIIIKLGGSVVTYKDSAKPKARLSVIKQLATEINAAQKSGDFNFIIVHGAGSFGHPLVKKYNLHLGVRTDVQKKACIKTRQQMIKLNKYILQALAKEGLLTQTFHPHLFTKQSAGKFKNFTVKDIKQSLKNHMIPLLYGDMVEDDLWGGSVLSGDTIVSFLAKRLKAEKVIFLSDVDGVFNKNPKKDPSAKLIPEINNRNYQAIIDSLSPSGRDDVTGEMRGKLESIKKQLSGIEVSIINGIKPKTFTSFLQNQNIGTKLLLH